MNIHAGGSQHFQQSTCVPALRYLKSPLGLLLVDEQIDVILVVAGMIGSKAGVGFCCPTQYSDLILQSVQSLFIQVACSTQLLLTAQNLSQSCLQFRMESASGRPSFCYL